LTGAPKILAKYGDGNYEAEDFAAALEFHPDSKKGLHKKW
jgi:hypothetical protein